MQQIAKLFANGRSQAVRIPSAFRFEGTDEVFIRRDQATGDLILSARPQDWSGLIDAVQELVVPEDFLRVPEDEPPVDPLGPRSPDEDGEA